MVLICISLIASDVEYFFHIFMGHLYVLPGEVFIQVLFPFFIGLFVFLVLSHISSLCILEIKPLSDVPLASMSSYTVSSFSFC